MRDTRNRKSGRPPSEEICPTRENTEFPAVLKMLNIRRLVVALILIVASVVLFLVVHTTQCFVLCLISGYFILQNQLLKHDYRKGLIACECVEADQVQESGKAAQLLSNGRAKVFFNGLSGEEHYKFVVSRTMAEEIDAGRNYRIYFRKTAPEVLLGFEEI